MTSKVKHLNLFLTVISLVEQKCDQDWIPCDDLHGKEILFMQKFRHWWQKLAALVAQVVSRQHAEREVSGSIPDASRS